jgi:sugar phosphate isomerase/epimerase
MGYWHDTGHAETFVRIGWVKNHLETIEPLKDHLIGFHLHDMKRLQDHFAPGSGDFNFDVLKPFINKTQCKVVEAHNKSTAQEVSRAIPFLQEKGF